MKVLEGVWGSTPIIQTTSAAVAYIDAKLWNGYDKPSHRPRADDCPDVCHVCPLLENPDGKFDVMPGCMGGAVSNDMEMCHCEEAVQ